jgi:hypothetical protein
MLVFFMSRGRRVFILRTFGNLRHLSHKVGKAKVGDIAWKV